MREVWRERDVERDVEGGAVWHLIAVHDPGDFERNERELADGSARRRRRRGHGRDHPREGRAEPDRE